MKFKLWLIAILITGTNLLPAQIKYVNNDTSSFLKIMLVGDVSMTEKVLATSFVKSQNAYDFQHIFHYIRPVLNLGDIVVGNVENSFGADSKFMKGGLNNAPDEYGVALKYAGFNLLMGANQTSIYQELDQWLLNKEYLDEINITQIGSFEHEDDRYKRNPTIIEKYGIKVAFLNYMDGIPFYPEVTPLVNGIQEDVIKRDIILAKNRGADFTIVYMNWGSEYQGHSNSSQQNLARLCLEEGANMVVGSHPHVVQEVYVHDDLVNGKPTYKVLAYSLGDFVSTTTTPMNNSSCILEVVLEKDKETDVAFVRDLGYIPTYTAIYQDIDGSLKHAIMPVSQVEKLNINVPINTVEKQWMSGASEKTRHKFSGQIDEIEYELDDEIIDDVAEVLTVTKRPLNESKDFALGINNHLLLALSGFMEGGNAGAPIVYDGIVYKVQFLSLRREIPIDLEYYKHLKGYETYFEEEYFHYVIGNYRNLKQANDFCLDVKRNGHKYAYVVAFENGERIK